MSPYNISSTKGKEITNIFVPFVLLIHRYKGKPIKDVKTVERQTKMKQFQNPSFFGKKRMSSKLIKKL